MRWSYYPFLLWALLAGALSTAVIGMQASCADGLAAQQSNDATNHFSRLSQINSQSVSQLGLAWSLDLSGEHTLEAAPIEVDGVLYFSGQRSSVYAVNALTGA